jgi:putative glutamine amidotransferase
MARQQQYLIFRFHHAYVPTALALFKVHVAQCTTNSLMFCATRSRCATPAVKPNVLLPCDNRIIGGHPMYVLGQKYADAVRDQAQCVPIPFPANDATALNDYLALADGVLLTGSPSNVHPSHFGQAVHDPNLPLDAARDSATLPLIRRVIELGMPLLAICRGTQEINVALGGTLHQAVQEVPGRFDHRGAKGNANATKEEAYALAHTITIVTNSTLGRILLRNETTVNSVHGQGIDQLADGLSAEAHASDGQIEAVSIQAHRGFNLALQWHPEWRAWENEDSIKIFAAFGDACARFRQHKSTTKIQKIAA